MVRPRIWRSTFIGLLMVMSVIVTNCASQNTTPTAPGVLVYAASGQPTNLESGNITDGNSLIVQNQIYNRLIQFKPGTADLEPSLATSWSVSKDGKTWTFKLRKGVKFHDGTEFNAQAVKFNVDRWWDKKNPNGFRNAGKSYEIWGQIFGGYKGEPDSLVQDVKVINPLTIQFVLKQPFAAFPTAIASSYFGIASPTAIQKAGANYGTPASGAIGTGAFVFKGWQSGDRITLEKNPNYWKPNLPQSNQLVMRFVTDSGARLAQVRAGQVDFTVELAPDQKQEIEQDQNLAVMNRPSFNVGYLALNPSFKQLSDVRVRQAIAHAINREALVQAFWKGSAQTTPHFLPPSLDWATSPKVKGYDYNPDKAKELLKQAGFANGFEIDLWYMPVARPYFPTPKAIAEAFAADLQAVGIKANLKTKDWAAYLADRNKKPGYPMFMLGWTGDYGDPDTFYYPHFGPGSTTDLGNWKNDRVIQLLNQARLTGDRTRRAKLYAEVDEIIQREAVRLSIVHSDPLLVQRKSIAGWTPSPLGTEPFEAIRKQ
ncbi:ABC transporter substrate-binding protein [Leptolyngbya boryana CZ1]|uniref:ABC transporter substrate-binding protein n=1 Tax=Leptolyngbya boryana CZ1 TaxID=3060204 RepID=A0AA97AUV3_LEPBY|nr:ABC transporter substrate-binding protein [Leptolyngbya boryana]WNZ46840.1 ABC transporter substrate-binding protein [Leptolyngbya boryana CZ1]